MYRSYADKAYWERAWWQMHKDAASFSKQIEKAAAEQPPSSHLERITKLDEQCQQDIAGERKDQHISDVLQRTSSNRRAGVKRPARTDLQQLCTDTGGNLKDLPEARDHRDGWRERERERERERTSEISASITTPRYIYIYIYIYIYANV